MPSSPPLTPSAKILYEEGDTHDGLSECFCLKSSLNDPFHSCLDTKSWIPPKILKLEEKSLHCPHVWSFDVLLGTIGWSIPSRHNIPI